MLDVKGTKTEENLKMALSGESKARNKYDFFAEQARNEGYMQIADIFENTADNEKAHGRMWYKILNGGIGTTEENLRNSLSNEATEADEMYLEFAKKAREEGLDEIAELFQGVASIEAEHNEKFKKLLANIENEEVFKKNHEEKWECMICGYTVTDTKAPKICPVCGYDQSYFKISEDNF